MTARMAEIGECVEVISGPAFKSARFTDDPSDVPLIKGENVAQGYIAWDKSKFWPAKDTEGYERFGLGAGDIVLAMDRPWVTAGLKWARLKLHEPPSLLVQRVARLRAKSGLRQDYLTYVIASAQFSKYVRNIMGGTNVPHISGDQIKAFKFRLPGENEQAAIAGVLSAYDDLIENNRRRMALLEEAARLLYREWFVHFRFPGHEHVKIIDGIPEGWDARKLGKCVTFQSGGTPRKSKAEYWSGDIPWISSGELTTMRVGTAKLNVTDEAVAEGSRYAEKGTILAVVRGMSLAKEFRIGLVSRRVCFNQDVKALVPDRGIEGLFLFHSLSDRKDRICQQAAEASHGTKKLETSVLEELLILCPPPAIRRHFIDHVAPMHAQWDVLFQQNQKLAQARDLLLPRLMNGEIAV